MIPVELAPDVSAALRAMKDRGTPTSGPRTAGRSSPKKSKNEIYDGATPYSTYVRGVIIDGDGGVLLTGRDSSALIIEG